MQQEWQQLIDDNNLDFKLANIFLNYDIYLYLIGNTNNSINKQNLNINDLVNVLKYIRDNNWFMNIFNYSEDERNSILDTINMAFNSKDELNMIGQGLVFGLLNKNNKHLESNISILDKLCKLIGIEQLAFNTLNTALTNAKLTKTELNLNLVYS